MKREINWWELGDKEIFLLDKLYCDFVMEQIRSKHRNLNNLRFKLGIGLEIYHSLKKKDQGINNFHLQKILKSIDIKFDSINDKFIGIGKYKSTNLKFPVKITPLWSSLLSHAFFDGYADNYIMRYSNYDSDNRAEFSSLVKGIFGDNIKFNNPNNTRRGIDLPATIPRLLVKFFDVKTFYSRKCRIPKSLFAMTKENHLYGYYFLKSAYIDEGSISGGQLWIVRGIVNKGLAKDVAKLSKILNIECRIKQSNKIYGGYSVGIKSECFDKFYDGIKPLFCNSNKKLLKLGNMILRHRIPLEKDKFGRFVRRETDGW